MTVPEALALIREVGGVEIRGGNLRVKFPEKDRARLQPALDTLRGCKDEVLAMVAAAASPETINTPGGKQTLLPPGSGFKPTSEQQWRKAAADKVFADHRKLQAAQYAGLSLAQKEELAVQAGGKPKDQEVVMKTLAAARRILADPERYELGSVAREWAVAYLNQHGAPDERHQVRKGTRRP
jgi:hypothetical protein